jgi:hypothetical protein
MSETNKPPPVYRAACLDDFFDEPVSKNNQNKYNYSHNDTDTIAKNQQEFGNRKRIKP